MVWGQHLTTWGHAEKRGGVPSHHPDYHVQCHFRFLGQYFDEESGLFYNRHRYYSPETAQYISPDPLGLLGGLNPYGYVHNPTRWIDPLGLAGDDCDKLLKKSSKKPVPPINDEHVFHGEVNRRGNAVGFHHEGDHHGKARIVQMTNPPNSQGIYTGKVEIRNAKTGQWIPKERESSFYPESWSQQKVLDEIKGAYQNATIQPNGKWSGKAPSGIRIEGWLDASGKINTAYPIYIK
ncbi:EndoU domain-containing protein [Xenorhabdus griffiniae]